MKPPYEQQHQQAAAAEIPLPRHQQQQQSRSSSRMSSIPQHYRSAASSASVHHHKSQHQHQHQHQHQQQQQNFPQSSRLSSVEPGESLNEIDEEEEREREKEQTAAGEDPLLQLENSTPTSSPALNITAQVGHPVYLHCIVESLGDKMVIIRFYFFIISVFPLLVKFWLWVVGANFSFFFSPFFSAIVFSAHCTGLAHFFSPFSAIFFLLCRSADLLHFFSSQPLLGCGVPPLLWSGNMSLAILAHF